jgi:uncharacterized membrane protein (UPF0127 family)
MRGQMRRLRLLLDVDDPRTMVRMRRLIAFVLVAGLVACAGESGSSPADPTLAGTDAPGTASGVTATGGTAGAATTSTTADLDGQDDTIPPPDPAGVPTSAVPIASARTALPGFGEVAIQVTAADGSVQTWCLLLAETEGQHERGLMEVTDPQLGGYDGMYFRFAEDHDAGGFYMRNTPQELSIAYLDGGGGLVSTSVMAPCGDVDGCPTYDAAGPYRATIEVPTAAGGVERLGITPSAVVQDLHSTCRA